MYNIVIEFGIPMKQIVLMKMCLNETYSRVQVGKHVSYEEWLATRGWFNTIAFQLCFRVCH